MSLFSTLPDDLLFEIGRYLDRVQLNNIFNTFSSRNVDLVIERVEYYRQYYLPDEFPNIWEKYVLKHNDHYTSHTGLKIDRRLLAYQLQVVNHQQYEYYDRYNEEEYEIDPEDWAGQTSVEFIQYATKFGWSELLKLVLIDIDEVYSDPSRSFLATGVLGCLVSAFNEIIVERERYTYNSMISCSEHIIIRSNNEDQIMLTFLLHYIHKYKERIRNKNNYDPYNSPLLPEILHIVDGELSSEYSCT